MSETQRLNPFDPEVLQQTVEAELEALGWVESISEEVRNRVSEMVNRFINDKKLEALSDDAASIIQGLEMACAVRRYQLDNDRLLNHRALATIAVNKRQQEGLPETIYPAVYIRMLEQAGVPVLKSLRASFEAIELKESQRGGKTVLLEGLKIRLAAANFSSGLQDSLEESLDKFLSRPTGKKRLGELLFPNDGDKLDAWQKIFPIIKRDKLVEAEAETLPTPEVVAEKFFKERRFSYLVGNPTSAPGIKTAMKAAVEMLVGESQKRFLSINISGNAFCITLGGNHNVDRKRLEDFVATMTKKWRGEFRSGEELNINLETNNKGGSEGSFVDI